MSDLRVSVVNFSTMGKLEDQAMALRVVLEREEKLTASDLQTLRKNTSGVSLMTSKSDYFVFRMEVELLDAIRALDETSAKLIKKTNSLTKAIMWLTFVAVGLAVIQIIITVFGHK